MTGEKFKELYDLLEGVSPKAVGKKIEIRPSDENSGKILMGKLEADFSLSVTYYDHYTRLLFNVKDNADADIFVDTTHFWERLTKQGFKEYSTSFGILFYKANPLGNNNSSNIFYDQGSKTIYINGIQDTKDKFFSNLAKYLEFLNFLDDNKSKEINKFRLTDHFNWNDSEVFFTNPKKEGKITFAIPGELPKLPSDTDLAENYKVLVDAFASARDSVYYPRFIKSSIFDRFSALGSSEPTTENLFKEMPEIKSAAGQNLGAFMSDLSLDQFKKDFLDLKVKYFGSLRDVLGKISTQIIGLPLSVSATALASYSIKELSQIPPTEAEKVIYVLAVAFSIYSLFAAGLLGFYREDILDTQLQANKGFEDLFSQTFFTDKKGDKTEFLAIKKAIQDRIFIMKIVLWTYIFLLAVTNSILLHFLVIKITASDYVAISFGLLHLVFFDLKFKSTRNGFNWLLNLEWKKTPAPGAD